MDGQRTTKQQVIQKYATLCKLSCQSPFLVYPDFGSMPCRSINKCYFSVFLHKMLFYICIVAFQTSLCGRRHKSGVGGEELVSVETNYQTRLVHISGRAPNNMIVSGGSSIRFPGIHTSSAPMEFIAYLLASFLPLSLFLLKSQLLLCARAKVQIHREWTSTAYLGKCYISLNNLLFYCSLPIHCSCPLRVSM